MDGKAIGKAGKTASIGNEIMVVLEQSGEYNGEPSLLYHGLKHQAQALRLLC
ncbi:hypothetical protein [Pseudomonas rustica]